MISPAEVSLLARDVIKEYHKRMGATVAPIRLYDGIVPIIEQRAGITLEIKRVNWGYKFLLGEMRRYGDHAEIIYSSNLNVCWSRFVLAKELTHLLIDTPAHYTTDPVTLLNRIILNYPPGIVDDIDSEWAAFFGAIFLLIPEALKSQIHGLHSMRVSDFDIAKKFSVPEKIVSYYLSDDFTSVLTRLDGMAS